MLMYLKCFWMIGKQIQIRHAEQTPRSVASDLGLLFAQACLSQYLGLLRYIVCILVPSPRIHVQISGQWLRSRSVRKRTFLHVHPEESNQPSQLSMRLSLTNESKPRVRQNPGNGYL